ncbi:hypothetical protein CF70_030060 [Cupriavidus sp. SK-3]|nr:hypothetical protein CF70_030060 [Cupriavidus sp. SK-3]
MRGRHGLALSGQLHQPRRVHLQRRRAAWQVAFDTGQPRLRITLTPTRDLHASDSQLLGDVLVLHAVGGQQHDARALRQPHARELRPNQPRQLGSLLVGQHDLGGNSHSLSPRCVAVEQ